MPEGDTIFRAARALHRALAGRTVTRFQSVFPALNRVHEDRPLTGRRVESVAARGKHLLMTFSDDLVLHTHMRMNGRWHLYRAGERWRRPSRDMRIVIGTDAFEAVAFNVQVAELLSSRQLARHAQLASLGPDLLDAGFDRHEALLRMRARGGDAIGDVLLDQRVLAGIGNVLKSEILFVGGVHPFAPVEQLSDAALEGLLDAARRLLAVNVRETPERAFGRRTTGAMNPDAALWVYGRGGKPCRRCGATVRATKTGLDARVTCWCPSCQPEPPLIG